MEVSACFDSFDAFMEALRDFEESTYSTFSIIYSQSAEAANKKRKYNIPSEFKIAHSKYGCYYSGHYKSRVPIADDKRKRKRSGSVKIGCEANFVVKYNERMNKLVITKSNLCHNHELSYSDYSKRMKIGKLPEEQRNELQEMLNQSYTSASLLTQINSKYGKSLELKDLRNLKHQFKTMSSVPVTTPAARTLKSKRAPQISTESVVSSSNINTAFTSAGQYSFKETDHRVASSGLYDMYVSYAADLMVRNHAILKADKLKIHQENEKWTIIEEDGGGISKIVRVSGQLSCNCFFYTQTDLPCAHMCFYMLQKGMDLKQLPAPGNHWLRGPAVSTNCSQGFQSTSLISTLLSGGERQRNSEALLQEISQALTECDSLQYLERSGLLREVLRLWELGKHTTRSTPPSIEPQETTIIHIHSLPSDELK